MACHAGRGPALRLELVDGAGLADGGDGAAIDCVPCAVEGEVNWLELAGRAEGAVLVEVLLGPLNALALLRAREWRARRRAAVLCAGRALRHDAADREGVEGAVLDPVLAGAARAGLAERAAEAEVEQQLVEAGWHTQVKTSTTLSCAWLAFAGHASHGSARCPGTLVFCHVLAPQVVHTVRPSSRATLPSAQAWQVSASAAPTLAENLPAGQASQTEELTVSAKVPAEQGVHS